MVMVTANRGVTMHLSLKPHLNRTKLRELINMRKFFTIAVCALLVVGFTGVPKPAKTQTPLQIIWKSKMKFGSVAASIDGAGAVTIDAVNNTRTVTGAAWDFGGTWQRGKFQLIGGSKEYVIVTLPSSFTLTNSNGNFSIVVDNITMSRPNPIRLTNAGKRTVYLGGRVNITTNQKAKTYGVGGGIIDAEYL